MEFFLGLAILFLLLYIHCFFSYKKLQKLYKLCLEVNKNVAVENLELKKEIMELKPKDKTMLGIFDYLNAQKKKEPLGVPVSYRQSEPVDDEFLTQSVIRNMNALNMNMTFPVDSPSDTSDSSCSDSSSDCRDP